MDDQLRIGDGERHQVATQLQRAFSEGRIDEGELEARLETVYSAKTNSDLVPMTSDLPLPVEQQPQAPSALGSFLKRSSPIWAGPVGISVLVTLIWVITTPTGYFWPVWVYLGVGSAAVAALFAKWQFEESGEA